MNLNRIINLGINRLWITLAVFALMLACAGRSYAGGYKAIVGGVSVSYSLPGASAYYDSTDQTLTVFVTQSGGSLSITAGSTAAASWGDYVDIYILANNTTFNSISIKGSKTCVPYICGDVYYVKTFSLSGGVVGNTSYYGYDFGLGAASTAAPSSISLKTSWTTAQLLGYPNQ